jgi:hypothetical protein
MKKLLSLAIASAAFAAMSQPIYAKPDKEKAGRGAAAAARGEVRQRAVQQPRAMPQPRVVQQPSRTANIERRAVQRTNPQLQTRTVQRSNEQAQLNARARSNATNRTITRTQPSVAFGGQTQAERRTRTLTNDRTTVRRERRDRDWDRDRDGDWNRGERRFRRPPTTVFRNWDRGRIHNWNNHRWHWYNNSWVIVGAPTSYVYYDYDYDEPMASAYVYSSGSSVADVQRELAREGYDPGPIDGVMGGQTRSAIIAFQQDNGLAVTGRIDSELLSELGL